MITSFKIFEGSKLNKNDVYQRVLDMCKEKNYTLIEPFEYKNTNSIIHLKCNIDGHEWSSNYNNFINKNRGCEKCGFLKRGYKKILNVKKKNEQKVLDKCKEKNYTLIKPFKYNGNKSEIHLKCNICKYDWHPPYYVFIDSDHGCPNCAGNLKLTQKEAEQKVLDKCKEKNYTLIEPFKYKNNSTIIRLKCNIDGHEWSTKYSNFINSNKGCKKCAGSLKLTQEIATKNVEKKCKEINCSFEPFVYVNNDTIIHLKCNIDGCKWKLTYDGFVHGSSICPKCAKVYSPTQKEAELNVLNKCKERNYTLLEPFIYKNSITKIHLKCNKNHGDWFVSYVSFIKQNSGCPICQESKGEQLIAHLLTNMDINFIRQKRFIDLKRMSFDFYLPLYNTCIEFDGEQHYRPINRFGGEEKFEKLQKRDKIKTIYCESHNIKLIRIRYDEMKNIKERLKEIFE